jgi:hypothetical protein
MWTWSKPTRSRRAGKRLEGDTGESSVMKFMRTPIVCEVVLGLLSVDTMKLEFMSIRETQQQQNFRF